MQPYSQTIELDQLHAAPQIRTRNGMDRASLAQLAESLKARGMLQPIVVRQNENGFVIIAGHRRAAAARMAGWPVVPCIVRDDDDAGTLAAQIAENVQRENLTLADTADAVRKLADQGHKPAAICKLVNKSPAWVSKHLALTKPSFSQNVRHLLETDATTDLDLLLTLDQIERHPQGEKLGQHLIAGVIDGTTTRTNARAALERLKNPPPLPCPPVPPEAPDPEDTEAEGDAMTNAAAALRRTFRLDIDVSTLLWLRHHVREDVPACVRRDDLLAKLDTFAAECGVTAEQVDIED